jgi:hypothetical protein
MGTINCMRHGADTHSIMDLLRRRIGFAFVIATPVSGASPQGAEDGSRGGHLGVLPHPLPKPELIH